MTFLPQNLYAIAAGYDVSIGSLVQLSTVVASGDNSPFNPPACRGYYDPGKETVRYNGVYYYQGYALTAWAWAAMSWNQYVYLYSTPLNNAFSGPVTIYTRLGPLGSASSYFRMNAVLTLPKPSTFDGKFYAPKRVIAGLTYLRTAA